MKRRETAVRGVLAIAGLLAGSAEAAAQRYGEDTVFAFVKPCRVFDSGVDTVYSRGPLVGPNSGRAFRVAGTKAFDTQGGVSGGCGVPEWATGVSLLIKVRSEADGFLVVYAYDRWQKHLTSPPPGVASLVYSAGRLDAGAFVSAVRGDSVAVYSSAAARVVGDVVGYYAARVAASFYGDGRVVNTTSRIGAVTPGSDSISVAVRGDIAGCTPLVSLSTIAEDRPLSVYAHVSAPGTVTVSMRPALASYALINLSVDC